MWFDTDLVLDESKARLFVLRVNPDLALPFRAAGYAKSSRKKLRNMVLKNASHYSFPRCARLGDWNVNIGHADSSQELDHPVL